MFISRFLRIAIAIASVIIMVAFGSTAARAQCDCTNTIQVDLDVTCCIRLADFSVQCAGGTIQPAFPSAGPTDVICPGNGTEFPCPCPDGIRNLFVAGTQVGGGAPIDLLYDHTCCLHFSINVTPDGCIHIVITNGTLCSLDRTKPHLPGSLLKPWPYARG